MDSDPPLSTFNPPRVPRIDMPISQPRRESLLPPRNVPAATSSGALIAGAVAAAATIENSTARALVMLACALSAWAIGYFTQPPRRRFRRDDTRPR